MQELERGMAPLRVFPGSLGGGGSPLHRGAFSVGLVPSCPVARQRVR